MRPLFLATLLLVSLVTQAQFPASPRRPTSGTAPAIYRDPGTGLLMEIGKTGPATTLKTDSSQIKQWSSLTARFSLLWNATNSLVTNQLAGKANQVDIYNRLALKADTSRYYDKGKIDLFFINYRTFWPDIAQRPSTFPSSISLVSGLDTALADRATKADLKALLTAGADTATAYPRSTTNYLLGQKADLTGVYSRTVSDGRYLAGAIPFSLYAIDDSTADNTANLQIALTAAAGRTLLIEKAYQVNTGSLTIPSNTIIEGKNGAKLKTTSPSGNVLSATGKKNISIRNLAFSGPNGDVKALYVNNVVGLDIDRTSCSLIGLLRADNSRKVSITKSTGTNSYTSASRGSVAAIDFSFTSYVTVDSCNFSGYRFGVQYWGGDANPVTQVSPEIRTPVALSVARGCTDITVKNSQFNDTYAGFWGSMGRNIVANNVRAIRARDVVIDYEGTINGKVIDSYVQDAENGGVATFFLCDSIVWRNVESVVSLPGMRAFGIHNIGSSNSGSLLIDNLRVRSSQADAQGGYVTGAFDNLQVINSSFTNVSLDFTPVLGHNQAFSNNIFYNTLPIGIPLKAGNVVSKGSERGVLSIENNRLTNQSGVISNTPTGFGIQIFHASQPVDEKIAGTVTKGFALDLVLQPQSNTLVANQTSLELSNNTFGNGQVFVSPPSGSNLALVLRASNANNRNGQGSFIPNLGTYLDAKTPVSIDMTGLAAGNILQVNGSGTLVPVAPTYGNVNSIAGVTGGSLAYAPVLTLPASSAGSYDYANIVVSLGTFGGSTLKTFNLVTGQRDSFHATYTQEGPTSAPGGILGYQQANGTTIFYVVCAPSNRATVTYLNLVQATPVTGLVWNTSSPAGTLIFDTNSTTRPTNPVFDNSAAPANGDLMYFNAGAWKRLPAGTNGQFLKIVSGLPAWSN